VSGAKETRQPSQQHVSARARLRPKSQLTLPEEIRRALHVCEGDEIEFTVREDGTITVRGYASIPTDQMWLYKAARGVSPAADEAITARPGMAHESGEAMFKHLDVLGAADA
jgi:antitoxin PrlF